MRNAWSGLALRCFGDWLVLALHTLLCAFIELVCSLQNTDLQLQRSYVGLSPVQVPILNGESIIQLIIVSRTQRL